MSDGEKEDISDWLDEHVSEKIAAAFDSRLKRLYWFIATAVMASLGSTLAVGLNWGVIKTEVSHIKTDVSDHQKKDDERHARTGEQLDWTRESLLEVWRWKDKTESILFSSKDANEMVIEVKKKDNLQDLQLQKLELIQIATRDSLKENTGSLKRIEETLKVITGLAENRSTE